MDSDLKPGQRATRCLVLAILGLALLANCVEAAGLDQTGSTRQENPRQENQWLQEHLLNDKAQLPFSFLYDRQGSSTLLKAWRCV